MTIPPPVMGAPVVASLRSLPGFVSLLTLLLLVCAGCQGPAARDPGTGAGPSPGAKGSEPESTAPDPASPPTLVAPIATHGRGRAPMGPGAPPTYFLSEQEAIEAIRQELTEAGIALAPTAPAIADLVMPAMTRDDLLEVIPSPYLDKVGPDASAVEALIDDVQVRLHSGLLGEDLPSGSGGDSLGARIAAELLPPGRPAPDEGAPWRSRVGEAMYPGGSWPSIPVQLQLDGAEAGGIAFEFVSQDDWVEWKPEVMEETDEEWTLALYDTALSLRTGLVARGGGGVYALFYDPCVLLGTTERTDADGPEAQAARTRALELLMAQVEDFLEWYAHLGPHPAEPE